jgi:hypothetical protein
MTTQQAEKTHTLRVINGGNAHGCFLSQQCLTLMEYDGPVVTFFIGSEENSVTLNLVITAIEIIRAPNNVSMKGFLKKEGNDFLSVFLENPISKKRQEREFIFSNYNFGSRKGWVQIPEYYVERITDLLKKR